MGDGMDVRRMDVVLDCDESAVTATANDTGASIGRRGLDRTAPRLNIAIGIQVHPVPAEVVLVRKRLIAVAKGQNDVYRFDRTIGRVYIGPQKGAWWDVALIRASLEVRSSDDLTGILQLYRPCPCQNLLVPEGVQPSVAANLSYRPAATSSPSQTARSSFAASPNRAQNSSKFMPN